MGGGGWERRGMTAYVACGPPIPSSSPSSFSCSSSCSLALLPPRPPPPISSPPPPPIVPPSNFLPPSPHFAFCSHSTSCLRSSLSCSPSVVTSDRFYSLTALALGLPVDQKKGDNRITTGNTAQKSERGPGTRMLFSEIVFRPLCAKIFKS